MELSGQAVFVAGCKAPMRVAQPMTALFMLQKPGPSRCIVARGRCAPSIYCFIPAIVAFWHTRRAIRPHDWSTAFFTIGPLLGRSNHLLALKIENLAIERDDCVSWHLCTTRTLSEVQMCRQLVVLQRYHMAIRPSNVKVFVNRDQSLFFSLGSRCLVKTFNYSALSQDSTSICVSKLNAQGRTN